LPRSEASENIVMILSAIIPLRSVAPHNIQVRLLPVIAIHHCRRSGLRCNAARTEEHG
jgi:hypothetical protein